MLLPLLLVLAEMGHADAIVATEDVVDAADVRREI